MNFLSKLTAAWACHDSLLCVGLDPDPARFPADLRGRSDRIYEFCRAIVDACADQVCAFKPQIAYFASHCAEDQLAALIAYIHSQYPQLAVILDAKRGDIGSTAEHYAREAFERYQADAVTVNPYMGFDSVRPFLSYPGRGAIVLCRTSNESSAEFQDLQIEPGVPLYLRVARLVAERWNTEGQCALVVGATVPGPLRTVRLAVGDDLPLLVPGVGAQGGEVAATVQAGRSSDGRGLLISSSRAVLYASKGEDFADAARRVAIEVRRAIDRARYGAAGS